MTLQNQSFEGNLNLLERFERLV